MCIRDSSYPLGSIKRHIKNKRVAGSVRESTSNSIVANDSTRPYKCDVTCPQIVNQYNAHMGGVDLADMLYRTSIRTHQWYMGIFSQLLDICVNNAWLLYRRENKLLGRQKVQRLNLKL